MEHFTYTTQKGVEIFTLKGKKTQSEYDFIVKFREPNKRDRTPKHIHLIVEMYVKYAYDKELSMKLREHILNIFNSIQPINYYPPKLQFFKKEHCIPFQKLNEVGEFDVDSNLFTLLFHILFYAKKF